MGCQTKTDKGFQNAQEIKKPLEKRLFDLKEAAIYLARPVYSIRCLLWKGALAYVKEGRKLYLDVYDMDSYIERNKEPMI